MTKDFVEEVYCTIPEKIIRYDFSTKYKHRKLKIVPQVIVTIQQGKQKVRLENIQVTSLYEMVKKRQEKLDAKHIRNSAS